MNEDNGKSNDVDAECGTSSKRLCGEEAWYGGVK
jgi:hypothetical protein